MNPQNPIFTKIIAWSMLAILVLSLSGQTTFAAQASLEITQDQNNQSQYQQELRHLELVEEFPAGSSLYKAGVHGTWSIVAVDPVTGDVGVAGASCAPQHVGMLGALVPGKGVAATQAIFKLQNRDKVFELLQQGSTASEIIQFITDDSYDQEAYLRQYGVVTLHEGIIQVAGFTGENLDVWAGDRQNAKMAVSVQGNTLVSEAVVSDALAAFSASDIGPVELPDRLMRALEAGSAAGGDSRCNEGDAKQTAQGAFIAVSKAGQPPFAAPKGGEPSPDDPALPWLFISLVEPAGGPNPLIELRSKYDTWRVENIPPCSDCNLDPIPVPPGGRYYLQQFIPPNLVPVVVILFPAVIFLGLVVALIVYKRKRKQRE